jgi:hypothetical protein
MRTIWLLLLTTSLFLSGCTARAWYEGFQMRQRIECGSSPQSYEEQRCLEKQNAMTYDQYQRERERLQQGSEKGR